MNGILYGVFHAETGFCKLCAVSESEANEYAAELNRDSNTDVWYADRMDD